MIDEKNLTYNAALEDDRLESEKQKDYVFEEIVASVAPVNWVEKRREDWRKFPIFDQNGSGSCVAQTEAKEMGIMRFLKDGVYVHFSATDIYQRRKNKSSAGMFAVDARDILRKGGATLEILAPSQDMTDKEMDGYVVDDYKRKIGEVFKVPNYIKLPRSIDEVASVIQETGKGVMLWFYFEYREWTDFPKILNQNLPQRGDGVVRHSVTAVDFTLYQGKKAIIIEDSWGPQYGLGGQRVITEDFFNVRNIYAGHLMNFVFDDKTEPKDPVDPVQPPEPNKPKHTFNTDLVKGDRNADVVALQDILKYEGLFPSNVDSTGYYWSITSSAVYKWQVKHNVASMDELNSLQGNRVGPKTRAKLNELYS